MHPVCRAIASAVLVTVAAPQVSFAQEAVGHYRFRILDLSGDSAVAEGEFVLGVEPFSAPEVPAELLARAVGRSFWLTRRDARLTTCFSVQTSARSHDGREFYVGIIQNGVSEWSIDADGQVLIPLYRSPDAAASLVGTIQGSRMVGKVHQRDWHSAAAGPVEWLAFEADRVADATPNACARVLRLEGTRHEEARDRVDENRILRPDSLPCRFREQYGVPSNGALHLTARLRAPQVNAEALDAQSLTTTAIVGFAQGTDPAAIIDTHRRSEDTSTLIAIRHFADHTIRPIIDDLLLANSGAGDQFTRLY